MKHNNLDRRNFIKNISFATGGLILATQIGCERPKIELIKHDRLENEDFYPNLFVTLKPNGDLLLTASRSEMGQGIRTALTSVIADEMDADWDRVQIIQAVGNEAYGNQNTDGSRSIRTIFQPMREMGAMAKWMLLRAAANHWKTEVTQLKTESHFVVNLSTKERIGFGELAALASKIELPKTEELTFKDRDEYKYIGKGLKSKDNNLFVSGKANYGADIRLPNMKYAAVARCPVTFGKVKSFDAKESVKIKGVERVLELERIERPFGALGGVAVVAKHTWAALQGKDRLKVEWEPGSNAHYDTDQFMEKITSHVLQKGKEINNIGNVDKAFQRASKIVESTYQLPHLVHAPMETPNATAHVTSEGCEVWAPVQAPQETRDEIAEYLGIEKEKVVVHITFLGGGFGRKSKPDFVLEAVMLSKEMGAPVQVIWSREDDIRHSYYHANSAQYMKAALNDSGKVLGWLHRTAYPSITSTFMPGIKFGAAFEFEQGMTNMPYEIDNIRFENGEAEAHVRIGWLRSVYNIIHGFSVNVFADELAHAANQDPLQFRLNLIGSDRVYNSENDYPLNTARLKNVLKKAGENAKWGEVLPENHALGLAVHFSFYSYVASVVEISVINQKLRVHNVYTVIDCGRVVNKNTVQAQMEGAAMFGISLAYYGKISAKNGQIEQNNFNDYKMLRIENAPEVHVEIVDSDEASTGVGEPGVPVIAPAIVNAIFKITGERIRRLPLEDFGLV